MSIQISRRSFLQGSAALGAIAVTSSIANTQKPSSSQIPSNNPKQTGNYTQTVPTLCEMCVNKCAALARVENGVVTKLDPNPIFPKSKNMLCARGNAGVHALYDPDRLRFPLIREGKKGEGKFRRATWEEAYRYITEKTVKILEEEEDNRSSFLFCAGEGMAEHTFKLFYQAFGSSNWLNHASICLKTVSSAYGVTMGAYPSADLENATYIIMLGANRAEAIVTPDTMDIFKRTGQDKATLVCVDPRFSHTASKSDLWLPINPGTDLAFILALTYVAIKNELYDKEYVSSCVNGFEEYKDHILSNHYTPEWAQKQTGIPAEKIETIAREFMKQAPRAILYPGRRSTFSTNDFQLRRAMAIFQGLSGGIDVKGGLVFGKTLPLKIHDDVALLYDNAKGRAIKKSEKSGGYEDCAIVTGSGSWIKWRNRFLEDKMPYNVRGMFAYKHNPALNTPDSKKSIQMLKKMELLVVIDTMPSDTAMYADVILPECTYLERTDPVKTFGGTQPAIAQRKRVIEPMYETKPVREILFELSKTMSKPLFEVSKKYDEMLQDEIEDRGEEELFGEYDFAHVFHKTQEEINKDAVSKYPGAWEALEKYGVYYPNMDTYFTKLGANEYRYYPENKKFYRVNNGAPKTSSQKIECNLENLSTKGVDAMPTWHKSYEFKVPEGEFRFITGRHAQFTQSGTSNNALLRDLLPENYVWINARVAKRMGIRFGDTLEVSSGAGKSRIKAYPTEKIGSKVLFFVHGFGEKNRDLTIAYELGANDNNIIEDSTEPVYGASTMHETNVKIRKI